MKSDTKILIIVIALIIAIVIFQRVGCAKDKEADITIKPGDASDIADIISESEDALRDAAGGVDTSRVVNDPYASRGSDQMTSPRRAPDDDDFNYESNPYLDGDEVVANIADGESDGNTTAQTTETDEESNANAERLKEEQKKLEIEAERQKTKQFYSEVLSWLNTNTSATQARNKAFDIRTRAGKLRENAQDEESYLQSVILERAATMETYANRISATRGNDRKIRALLTELQNKLRQ